MWLSFSGSWPMSAVHYHYECLKNDSLVVYSDGPWILDKRQPQICSGCDSLTVHWICLNQRFCLVTSQGHGSHNTYSTYIFTCMHVSGMQYSCWQCCATGLQRTASYTLCQFLKCARHRAGIYFRINWDATDVSSRSPQSLPCLQIQVTDCT